MPQNYIVRTLFLQNYFAPSQDLARSRREGGAPEDIISAMKRTELANQTLEKELNALAQKGYSIVSVMPHPLAHQEDLLVTVVLSEATG